MITSWIQGSICCLKNYGKADDQQEEVRVIEIIFFFEHLSSIECWTADFHITNPELQTTHIPLIETLGFGSF